MSYTPISIHAPTRGATAVMDDGRYGLEFQSTLLQEERRNVYNYNAMIFNFNPRSYKRSDLLMNQHLNVAKRFQSTLLQEERHTGGCRPCTGTSISIHAPTRGATFIPPLFQNPNTISIHAPTRGATAKMHNYPYTYL